MNLPPSFESLYTMENLYHAWYKVSRGKSSKSSILDFYRGLDDNLAVIAEELRKGTYKPGPYNLFTIKDPKERVISASHVRDRVVQHALMNLYDPIFDRHLIFDTYACRLGKGTQKAALRAFHFAQRYRSPAQSFGCFLKMDVRKYFDSLDHGVLKVLLSRLIRDPQVLTLLYTIIDSYKTQTGRGIPIGNLTSQYFANFYLSGFDHYLKEQCRVKGYIRYMDDMLIFSDSKTELKTLYALSVSYIAERLHLRLKPPALGSVTSGAPFLGFLIKPTGLYLQRKSKNRYKARIAAIEHKRKTGLLSSLEAGRRIESVTAHLLLARSRDFRNTILSGRVLGY
jgi:retron-type reverse transcriptase